MNQDEAREGYRTAIQLISHDAKNIWDSFRSILAANAVLIGLAGAVLKLYPSAKLLTGIVAFLGLIVCIAWILITIRNFAHYKYCFAWARKYEKVALGSEDHIVQEGKKFADGNRGGEIAPPRLGWAGRVFRVERLIYAVIGAFILVYAFLLAASLIG